MLLHISGFVEIDTTHSWGLLWEELPSSGVSLDTTLPTACCIGRFPSGSPGLQQLATTLSKASLQQAQHRATSRPAHKLRANPLPTHQGCPTAHSSASMLRSQPWLAAVSWPPFMLLSSCKEGTEVLGASLPKHGARWKSCGQGCPQQCPHGCPPRAGGMARGCTPCQQLLGRQVPGGGGGVLVAPWITAFCRLLIPIRHGWTGS